MELSEMGKWAEKCMLEIPERNGYAKLDGFIVMPNHIHVIVVIDKMDDGRGDPNGPGCKNAINRVSTEKPQPGGITGNKNPMLHNNISRVFNWYKGRVTFESRKINKNFGWQPRFFDHIIRNNEEYQRIKYYIINNPKNWDNDKFFE